MTPDRSESVRDFYRKQDHARSYDQIRFGNAGGRIVDTWEKKILTGMLAAHPKDEPILEVAAGTGRFSLMLARMGYKVVAVDSSMEMLRLIQNAAEDEGLDIICLQADAFNMPFPDNAFLTVYSMRFVWHFKEYAAIIKEFSRIAKNEIVFDHMNLFSIGFITAKVANYFVYRKLHTELATGKEISRCAEYSGMRVVEQRTAFLFPYIFYRKLPFLAKALHWIDKTVLRILPAGSVMYFRLNP
ncbi:class I SAM-dependent methyltransferase [bacterium]|jgi:ubiquinone/menaquinone biosynthesis C-methylase UbiE|nr:class I SAM-dependent methyltransferase [bacterium]